MNSTALLEPHAKHQNALRSPRIEAPQRNKAFLEACRAARTDHLAGRDAVFPADAWRSAAAPA